MRDITINGEVNTDIYLEEYNEQFFLDGEVSLSSSIDGTSGIVTNVSTADPYIGEYTYTPTDETQTIPIMGLMATDDITINPIPSNYGLITWDGATLTVS